MFNFTPFELGEREKGDKFDAFASVVEAFMAQGKKLLLRMMIDCLALLMLDFSTNIKMAHIKNQRFIGWAECCNNAVCNHDRVSSNSFFSNVSLLVDYKTGSRCSRKIKHASNLYNRMSS